ncbi:MAG: MerR family transcriptional regulator [Bacteroidia bacterium]|jgi:DNA-binding transcriptional MerR regulator|nr:MerR family transcriptional regulator [Bacteroidia bacterium]
MINDEIEKRIFSISEVADRIGEAPSLIRFWEKSFPTLNPSKNTRGQRQYRIEDIEHIRLIHFLLKEKGMTIEGAKAYIKQANRLKEKSDAIQQLKHIKQFLTDLLDKLESK